MKDAITKPDSNAPQRMKRRAPPDGIEQVDATIPSPAFSATAATPKRPRLAATLSKHLGTPSHLDITKTLTKTPLTPQSPSKKPSRKQQLATDPINVSIYDLRKEGRDWQDIATRTNDACGLSERDELTAAACYSRFFRNGPLVAKEKGEEWRKEWYVYMKGAKGKAKGKDLDDGGDDDGTDVLTKEKAVLAAVEKVKAEFWANVTKAVNEGLGGDKTLSEEDVKAVYDRVGQGGDGE